MQGVRSPAVTVEQLDLAFFGVPFDLNAVTRLVLKLFTRSGLDGFFSERLKAGHAAVAAVWAPRSRRRLTPPGGC